MNLALIGVGKAGGRIVDQFASYDAELETSIVQDAIVFDTSKPDLAGLKYLPRNNRHLIGQSHPDVHGYGTAFNIERGFEVMQDDMEEIQSALDGLQTNDIDAFLVVAGLGGGTGGSGTAIICRKLTQSYTLPIYVSGILPDDADGKQLALNAVRSIKTVESDVDNIILFDNNTWEQSDDPQKTEFEMVNNELITRLGTLFSAGVGDDRATVGEEVIESVDIMDTLGDDGDMTVVGYSVYEIPTIESGLFGRKGSELDFPSDTTNQITTLVRQAASEGLSCPIDIDESERAMVIIAGPPKTLSQDGYSKATNWLEQEALVMNVVGGEFPLRKNKTLAATVVLSGMKSIPRVKELEQLALEAKHFGPNVGELDDDMKLELFMMDGDENEVTPLF